MRIRTRITEMARERALTAAEVSRRRGLYRSNLSGMGGGGGAGSLGMLERLAQLLGCGPADLLETKEKSGTPLFKKQSLVRQLEERDFGIPDGADRSWVHATLLAWQRHYGNRKMR